MSNEPSATIRESQKDLHQLLQRYIQTVKERTEKADIISVLMEIQKTKDGITILNCCNTIFEKQLKAFPEEMPDLEEI
jgi:hypothetical protein